MKKEKFALLKNSMNFGAVLGLATIAFSLIMYLLGQTENKNNPLNFVVYVLIVLVVILGTNYYRNHQLGGYISYGGALLSGLLIGLFGAIISSFYSFIFFKYIDPSMVDKMMLMAEDNIRESNPNMTEDQVEYAMSFAKIFMHPAMMFVMGIIGQTFVAFIISLITSIFIKKSDNTFSGTFKNDNN